MFSCGAETNNGKNTTYGRAVQITIYYQNKQSGKKTVNPHIKYSGRPAFILQIVCT